MAHDGRLHSGVDMAENVETLAATNLPDAGAFHVDWSLIGGGAVFLLLLLVLTSALLVRQMRRFSLRQLQAGEGGVPRSRRIISLHRASLTGVLTKRFMLARKRTFASIILSLALGSVIFLGATYVIENTRINNELVFAADDGLGSDIQLVSENGCSRRRSRRRLSLRCGSWRASALCCQSAICSARSRWRMAAFAGRAIMLKRQGSRILRRIRRSWRAMAA